MTNEKSLDELIAYAESAEKDDYPVEVTGKDRALVLRALKALKQLEPTGNSCTQVTYRDPATGRTVSEPVASKTTHTSTAAVEPKAKPGWQVHVQKNVLGLDVGLEYPKNCELVPYGPIFDTRDAAMLSVKDAGWLPIWWNVQQVNRS